MKKEQKATIGGVILVAILMIYVWIHNFVVQHPIWSIFIAVLLVAGAALLIYYTIKSPELKEKQITFFQHMFGFLKDIFSAMGEGGKEGKKRVPIPKETLAQVYKRANYLCQSCGEKGRETHHINGDPSNNHLNNLIYLCKNCHDKAQHGMITKNELITMRDKSKFKTHTHEYKSE